MMGKPAYLYFRSAYENKLVAKKGLSDSGQSPVDEVEETEEMPLASRG